MAKLTDHQINAALARGRAMRASEPRAVSARYNTSRGQIVVELTNGCALSFLPRLVPGLADAPAEVLVQVEILGAGYGLHWEAWDADISVPGLLAGAFGTRAVMAWQG